MKLKNYLPLKAVVEDLGVSRWTLWRAAASDIADFPQPTRVGRQIYWKKSEVEALEAALLRYTGRCAFDRKRKHEKKMKTLLKTKKSAAPRKRADEPPQRDLFSS